MKRYVNQNTNTAHYIADIRAEFPNTSFPDDADCSDFGYEFLIETTPPTQEGYLAREVAPIDNIQQWELVLAPIHVPYAITKVQAMRVLKARLLWDQFNTILSANVDANDEWVLATQLERNNPFVGQLAPLLGLTTEAAIDELFIDGSKL